MCAGVNDSVRACAATALLCSNNPLQRRSCFIVRSKHKLLLHMQNIIPMAKRTFWVALSVLRDTLRGVVSAHHAGTRCQWNRSPNSASGTRSFNEIGLDVRDVDTGCGTAATSLPRAVVGCTVVMRNVNV
jgi:hypothetical protein